MACNCSDGFEPPFCSANSRRAILGEFVEDEMRCDIDNVCKNGGTCFKMGHGSKSRDMKCICKPGFTGIFCESS